MLQAHEDKRAAEVRALRELAEAYQVLVTAQTQATILKEQIIPEAQKAFDASTEGYQQGKFGYLDVLDAQRTLFETKALWIQNLADFYTAMANVEGLIGQSLDSINETKTNQEKNND